MKKQHEKCKSLIQEIDQIEVELTELSNLLLQKNEEFSAALSSSLREIDEIEKSRLDFIKSGFLRFFQANNGMSDHLTQIFDNLKNSITSLDIHIDVEAFERELEYAKSSFRDTSSLGSSGNSPQISNSSPNNNINSKNNSSNNNTNNTNNTNTSNNNTLSSPTTSGEFIYPQQPNNNTNNNNGNVVFQSQIDQNSQSLESINQLKVEDDESSHLYKSNLMVFDRLKDAIESFKRSAQRANGTFADISDSEKLYFKSAIKILDKHGYGDGNIASTTNMISSSFTTTEPKIIEVVDLYESKLCQSSWNHVIEVTHKLSEAHLTVSEILLNKCCVTTDNSQRRIDTIMREAIDRVHHVNKKIDGAKATQVRLKSKLNRVQKELRERRISANSPHLTTNSGRKSGIKDDLLDPGTGYSTSTSTSSSSTPPIATSQQQQQQIMNNQDFERNSDLTNSDFPSNRNSLSGIDPIDISNHTLPSPSSSSTTTTITNSTPSTSIPVPPPIQSSQRQRSEKGMIQGWESIGNVFGAAAVTALGAAGVLESSTERNNNRIANLEEEESACIESLNAANSSTQVVIDLCVNDLSAIIMTLKQGISKEMENMKTSLVLFIDGHTVGLNIFLNVLHRLKSVTEGINIDDDMNQFHSNIRTAAALNEERKVPNIFLLPQVEQFLIIHNDLVDLERENEKESIESGMNNNSNSNNSNNETPSGSLYSASSATAANFKNKSLITSTPRRRRSRGNSIEGETDQLPQNIVENNGSNQIILTTTGTGTGTGDATSPQVSIVSIGLQSPSEEQTITSPSPPSSTNTTSSTNEIKVISTSLTPPLLPATTSTNLEKIKSNQVTPEKNIKKELIDDNKTNNNNNSNPAPSECSVPDYDDETVQSLKIIFSPVQEKVFQDDTIVYPSESATISDDESESTTKKVDKNSAILRSTSNEIGTYGISAEEGLRRSVTTELRSAPENSSQQQQQQVFFFIIIIIANKFLTIIMIILLIIIIS